MSSRWYENQDGSPYCFGMCMQIAPSCTSESLRKPEPFSKKKKTDESHPEREPSVPWHWGSPTKSPSTSPALIQTLHNAPHTHHDPFSESPN